MKTIHQIPKLKTLLTAAIVSSGLFAIGFHALAEDADYSKIPGMPKLEIMKDILTEVKKNYGKCLIILISLF